MQPADRLGIDTAGPPARRRLGSLPVAVALIALLALPAGAQEAPEPTPSPSPTPSPTASPSPAPSPSGQTIDQTIERSSSPERAPRREKRRRPRRQRRRATWKPGPVRARQRCQPFSHTQTYVTWGPALAYAEPVTVVYDASQCAKPSGSAVELSMQGTAKVYRGTVAQGTPIDTRPFTVNGLWDRPENPSGWPPTWWSCDVKLARYSWEIGGVYTFAVSARWGVWSLEVTSGGAAARTVRWTYNAC